jgi:hypothetical protein
MTEADPGAVGARSVRLPRSSFEPAPQHRPTLQPERTSLPVRSSGLHMHPQLRRTLLVDPVGRAGGSA